MGINESRRKLLTVKKQQAEKKIGSVQKKVDINTIKYNQTEGKLQLKKSKLKVDESKLADINKKIQADKKTPAKKVNTAIIKLKKDKLKYKSIIDNDRKQKMKAQADKNTAKSNVKSGVKELKKLGVKPSTLPMAKKSKLQWEAKLVTAQRELKSQLLVDKKAKHRLAKAR